jgi:Terpene cyclase DEP1
MNRPTRTLCVVYGILAVAALVVTWSWNFAFFAAPDSGLASFLAGAYANPAAASLSSDLLFLTVVAVVWMVIEARRHEIRFVWLYVAMGFAVAISVAFPLFLIARERRLAAA